MSDVQVFDGDGTKPEDEFVSIPWKGFSVHANRKGVVAYHIFDRANKSIVVTRREFLKRARLSDETLTALEYGALAMRRWINEIAAKHDRGAAEFVWTVEDKMKERVL